MFKLLIFIGLIGCVFSVKLQLRQELECSRAGGICAFRSDCPIAIGREYEGLCPKQRSSDVECCHGVPYSDICEELGGICRSKCPKTLTDARASNCQSGEVCCILV